MLHSLKQIYPTVDIASHIIGDPITVSWEDDPNFMGAFSDNLPGHYRYQERLYTHFMQEGMDAAHRAIYLAGDGVSWTGGWADGAVTTGLNAVWGVMTQLGGKTSPDNPGPGDRFHELKPLRPTGPGPKSGRDNNARPGSGNHCPAAHSGDQISLGSRKPTRVRRRGLPESPGKSWPSSNAMCTPAGPCQTPGSSQCVPVACCRGSAGLTIRWANLSAAGIRFFTPYSSPADSR